MRIDQIIRANAPTVSCELTPSSDDARADEALGEQLRDLWPDFLSITYGPPGMPRRRSVELAEAMQRRIAVLAHLACVGHDQSELSSILDRLWAANVRNVFALRGQSPTSISQWTASQGDLAYASELVEFIRRRGDDFCIGVAGYPEIHPESSGPQSDLDALKRKIDAGGNFILTEFFFDNAVFFRFRDRVRQAGIAAPIIATLMPILHLHQARQVASTSRVCIGQELLAQIESAPDPQAAQRVGIAHALTQCRELLRGGVDGLHLYTLNNCQIAGEILRESRRAAQAGSK